jgi:hypothetical protein
MHVKDLGHCFSVWETFGTLLIYGKHLGHCFNVWESMFKNVSHTLKQCPKCFPYIKTVSQMFPMH